MLKKILIGLALVIIVLVVIVALQPGEYQVSRSITINAPPSQVFPYVDNFKKWDDWSPWVKIDPNAKEAFEGEKQGKGAIFKWSGNNEVGEGSMKITESKPNDLIQIKLDFVKPMEGTANVEFNFKEKEGNKTHVTWSMRGENNFIGKAMCLFMNMDRMIGEKYDEGLAKMKSVVEAENQ